MSGCPAVVGGLIDLRPGRRAGLNIDRLANFIHAHMHDILTTNFLALACVTIMTPLKK
jgi:hypothetical protein